MTGAGVPLGAASPHGDDWAMSIPLSFSVGTSGKRGMRVSPQTASRRSFPLST
ncbi:hypothetical protein D9M70_644220 [compost metagenome]